MSSDCKTLQELYAIREQISEEIKDMTPEEQAEYFNKGAEKTLAELGISLKRPELEIVSR